MPRTEEVCICVLRGRVAYIPHHQNDLFWKMGSCAIEFSVSMAVSIMD